MKLNKIALTDTEIEEIFPGTKTGITHCILATQNENHQQEYYQIKLKEIGKELAKLEKIAPNLMFAQIYYRDGLDDMVTEQIETSQKDTNNEN